MRVAACRLQPREAIASDACAEEIASAPMAKLLGILAFALLLHASTGYVLVAARHPLLSSSSASACRLPCSKLPCCACSAVKEAATPSWPPSLLVTVADRIVAWLTSIVWAVIGALPLTRVVPGILRFIANHATQRQLSFCLRLLRDTIVPVFTCALGVAELREETRIACEEEICAPEVRAALDGGMEAATAALEATIDTVLLELDINQDGVVTLREAASALSEPASIQQQQIRTALEAVAHAQHAAAEARIALEAATSVATAIAGEVPVDEDGDGKVSLQEAASWPARIAQRLWIRLEG